MYQHKNRSKTKKLNLNLTILESMKTKRKIAIDDFTKFIHLTEPRLSSDGKKIAFIKIRSNIKNNQYDYEIMIMNVNEREIICTIHSGEKEWTF